MTLLLKIQLFYRGWGGGILHSKLQLNPIHHTASLSTDLATPTLLPGKGRTVPAFWHLYLVGPDRGTDPPKDVSVYFKVLQWQKRSEERLRFIEENPKCDGGEQKKSGPPATFSWPNTSSTAFTLLQSFFLLRALKLCLKTSDL